MIEKHVLIRIHRANEMVRVFIAIDIEDPSLLNKLYEIQKEIVKTRAKMKLVERENMHITLKFLGEISPARLSSLEKAVVNACKNFTKFKIELARIGAFPSPARPRVIWIGVSKGAEILKQLAGAIEKETVQMGFKKADKPFHPHVTLARVKIATPELRNFILKNQELFVGEILVEEVRIKESILRPQGPLYKTLYRVELKS